jgi:hypothetical protein
MNVSDRDQVLAKALFWVTESQSLVVPLDGSELQVM